MKKLTLYMLLFAVVVLGSCKETLDINDNPNAPIDVQESLLLPPIELNIADQVYGGSASIILQYWLQEVAANQPNPGFWNYQMFNRDVDGDWYNYYVNILKNAKLMNEKAEASGNSNYAAIAKILSAYTLGCATDLWGDIPYSEAFRSADNFKPAYDKQEDIYKTLQSLLDNAISDINKNFPTKPAGNDYFYNGDMAKWLRLAYTLKARFYIHLTKAPGYNAQTQSDLALAALANGMQSNNDDLKFQFTGAAGAENILFTVFNPVSTIVLNETYVEGFKTRNDPRLSKLVQPAEGTGLYKGRRIGTAPGTLSEYSYPTEFYAGVGSASYLVNYTEALFIKAEATFWKSGAVAAQPIYQDAIRQHMLKVGVPETQILAYLLARGTLTETNGLQRIIEEKSISNFFNLENYNDWRRTGFPTTTAVNGALSAIPRRLLYPETELRTNPQPQHSAKLTDRVWWDAQ
ncbi:SusD/RagB family nutrient-binding outer membrane lipoprotein [Desertivirga arenae]|uniref:SusD/RagB family nutrient-binding outer membrane lipoprotein n=1 Tax=Desertivirga arenae TaxID=2810309 RepID=UPI001A9748D9|nr:SusD/RagB family nutrient-binding outer membrane lipoprotein [Pedobacter sp. SYSU D00823]